MRIQISDVHHKKRLVLQGEQIALQAPEKGDPLMIEAEIDPGSPIKIVIGSGKPMPVRRVSLIHKDTYHVKSFIRHTKQGEVKVPAHDRRKPYRWLRKKHSSI